MTRRNWSTSAETMLDDGLAPVGRSREVLSQILTQWESGRRPDALSAIAEYPEIAQKKSLVLELAYEEYCRRQELGEDLDLDQFCDRFPQHRGSVRRRLQVHRFVDRAISPPRPPTRWPEPPQEFCGFRLTEELGQGAIARVYLARQASLGDRTVVLKVSKGGSREAHLQGRLQHPNVVPVYSVAVDAESGLGAVCMPFYGRATFEDVLDQIDCEQRPPRSAECFANTVRRLNGGEDLRASESWAALGGRSFVDGVLAQFAQVADALAYLQSKGIYHRDLKPSNILLADDGRPMLLDFNLSSEVTATERRLGGTLPYMAPEQIRSMLGEPGNWPDGRADVYTFGVILFEMLTGAPPFGPVSKSLSLNRAGRDLLEKQSRGPALAKLRKTGADGRIAAIVSRCLTFDPEDRFCDAKAVALAIRAALRPVARARRWTKAHPIRSMAAALVVLAVIIIGIGALALQKPAWIKLYNHGVAAFEGGNTKAALKWFEESKQANPQFAPALLGVARMTLALGENSESFDAYQRLYDRTHDPKYLASMGYCKGLLPKHREAITYYSRALQEGFRTAAVFNNLAFSYMKTNSPEAAKSSLDQALQIDPRCGAALHNRAILECQRVVRGGGKTAASALDDIEQAIRQAPGFGNMHYLAASLWALSEQPGRLDSVVKHVERAIKLGFKPAQFQVENAFAPYREAPQMQQALQLSPGEQTARDPPRTLDPNPEILHFF